MNITIEDPLVLYSEMLFLNGVLVKNEIPEMKSINKLQEKLFNFIKDKISEEVK